MSEKITWTTIFTDFKDRHPTLAKEITHWCPHDHLTVLIYFEDGMKLTYNYLNHKATILTTN